MSPSGRCTTTSSLFAIFALAGALHADEPTRFDELREEIRVLRLSHSNEQASAAAGLQMKNIVECPEDMQKPTMGGGSQYIYNGVYEWSVEPVESRYCIFLIEPIRKTLSVDEAYDLLTASQTEFPVPESSEIKKVGSGPVRRGDNMPRIDLSSAPFIDDPQKSTERKQLPDHQLPR